MWMKESKGDLRMTTLKFHPARKRVAFFAMACLVIGITAAYGFLHSHSVLMAVCSGVAVVGFLFLLGPVLRNQTVEVGQDCIIVRTFGRPFELKAEHLVEVVRRKNGAMSYRFQAGNQHYQVTPLAYGDADIIQKHFDRLFDSEH